MIHSLDTMRSASFIEVADPSITGLVVVGSLIGYNQLFAISKAFWTNVYNIICHL